MIMNDINLLKESFEKYKQMTKNMIESFNKDVNIDDMFKERQVLLEKINNINIPGSEKKKINETMEIDKLDKKLGETIKTSLNKVKEDIKINRLRRSTTNAYNNVLRQQNLFSRRV